MVNLSFDEHAVCYLEATLKLAFLVAMVLFVSAVVFTNILWDVRDEVVAYHFGDLGRSMWTMFVLMTLDDWTKIVEPVRFLENKFWSSG